MLIIVYSNIKSYQIINQPIYNLLYALNITLYFITIL